jgi:hypothetical protein
MDIQSSTALGCVAALNSQKQNVSQPAIERYTNFPRIQD